MYCLVWSFWFLVCFFLNEDQRSFKQEVSLSINYYQLGVGISFSSRTSNDPFLHIIELALNFTCRCQLGGTMLPALFTCGDHLRALRQMALTAGEKPSIPGVMRRRRHGGRAGAKVRMKKRTFKPRIPEVIVGNVRLLASKIDKLETLTRSHSESSIMCFTETLLHNLIPDSTVTLPGFLAVWVDKHATASSKKTGEGLAFLLTIGGVTWAYHVLKACVCIRLYYLPWEFTNVAAITVYVPARNSVWRHPHLNCRA